MTSQEISKIRLMNQKISQPACQVKEIVSWMGAIQAQDYLMAKWAIGVRLSDPFVSRIDSSIDKGEILRIHVLRPTWHFVCAEDIFWMLRLSATKIRTSMKSRHKQLELNEPVISKASGIIEKSLSNGNNLTREELANEFLKANIRTDENRLSHILFCAELDELICSGPVKDNKLTYSLLSERVTEKKFLSREESLAELAKRYFTSRSPATTDDFAWWSNLTLKDARTAAESIKTDFVTESIGSGKYLIPRSITGLGPENTNVYLLPAYDEFLISYKDRSSSLSSVQNRKTVSDNGIFYPTIVIDGQVAGIWKRTVQKNKVIIDTSFFQPLTRSYINLVNNRATLFGLFLGKEAEIR
jgi:hypothetical protein